MERTLLFVYNAKSGFFNTIADALHKVTSPETYECNLCKLTHGHFTMKRDWARFIKELGLKTIFYHRDHFLKQYPDMKDVFPAVFLLEDGTLSILIEKKEMDSCKSLDEMMALVQERVAHIPAENPK